ncbi:MAG: DUF4430 domain-containing protein [Ruminococcaceae bacterium]|nr:DUF4430 domain-containing protein [Oscillospiraceae bacterium]
MKKFLFAAVFAILLACIFAGCEKTPTEQPVSQPTPQESRTDETPVVVPKDEPSAPVEAPPPTPQEPQEPLETPNPPVSESVSVEPVCTFSIRCDTILENTDLLDQDKLFLVPDDGVIFAATEISFADGESVFDLLSRITRENNIHLEFENTPIYNTAYIKGVANIYERDCGEGSGWLYRVNGEIPNHGCSLHRLQDGDVVEWRYTCNFGDDIN